MKLNCVPLLALAFGSLNVAALESLTVNPGVEIFNELRDIVDWSDHSDMLRDLGSLKQKRDTVSTIEYVFNAVNNSGIIFDVLDQIAYDPHRIELVANITGKLVGNLNTSSLSSLLEEVPLNYSLIYDSVKDSGVVTSLLDGVLLDDDYRPTLVKLVTRVLEGSKNILLYVVKDIFKKTKREDTVKRSTIETLVGNTIAAVLSSDLVSNIAEDTLIALNNTQFLTYTVKKLIANEGYQNMTAQIGIDLIRNGDLKLDANALNVTSIVDKALANPAAILKLVSSVLSGNLDLSGLGKYTEAIKEIISDTEDTGVFALLNDYVFSQTHTVSTPLIPTGNIVVPRKTSTNTKSASNTNATKTKSATTTRLSKTLKSTEDASTMGSAEQVASILSLLGASTYATSTSTSTSFTTSFASTYQFNLSEFLDDLSKTTKSSATSSTDLEELANILKLFGTTDNKEIEVSTSSSVQSSNEKSTSNSGSSSLITTKLLVYTQIVFVATLLFL